MAYAGTFLGVTPRSASVTLLSTGPGLQDETNLPRTFIFDAGKSCGAENPLLRFYAEEILTLDWLRDYLMDLHLTTALQREEDFMFRVDEELEDTYQKDALTKIDSDAGWADAS